MTIDYQLIPTPLTVVNRSDLAAVVNCLTINSNCKLQVAVVVIGGKKANPVKRRFLLMGVAAVR